jgi:acetyl esterase/lipase
VEVIAVMLCEQLNIWDDSIGPIKSKAVLKTYISDDASGASKPSVLVCPGGAYSDIADREGEPVALAFTTCGFQAFVLNYEVPPVSFRQPLLDVSKALCLIRENAEQWHTDANRIAVCGFSAGGHLAASLGVFWKDESIRAALGIPERMNKPNALILCYPVITSQSAMRHKESFRCLFSGNPDESIYDAMSLENYISCDTPATFVWHTFDDASVPVDNALRFAQGLKNNRIPFEMHIFPNGPHGLSLCDERTDGIDGFMNPHAGKWFDLCVEWLRDYAYTSQ